MIHRLFTAASVLSLLLCMGAVALWVRSRSKVDLWEVLTHGRNECQFNSSPREWAILHIADWPESPGVRHHASFTDADPSDMKEHSFAVFDAATPGTFVRGSRFLGVSFVRGRVSTLVGSDGIVIRVPPHPRGSLLQYASPAMPYWSVSFPGWLLPTALFLFPCGVLLVRARVWLRSRSRRKRGLCESCGFDLRASNSRCPECGKPIVILEILGAAPATNSFATGAHMKTLVLVCAALLCVCTRPTLTASVGGPTLAHLTLL
ncbi:MAG TPA: hypothetical protein VGI81_17570, partial [Tepidisphaeraceae bacterium]